MTDDTTHSESGRNSDCVTPTAEAALHTETSQPDEGQDEKNHQGMEISASDETSMVDQPVLTKPTDTSDAYLVIEEAPRLANWLFEREKEDGYKKKAYMNDVADSFSSEEIYDLWATKLQKYAESHDKAHVNQRTPRLARSFIDYVGTVDSRLQKIESRMAITSTETNKPDDAQEGEHSVQTRFYNASAQAHYRSGGIEDDEPGWNVKGSFLSEVDTKHCLRVQFNWVQDHTTGTESHHEDEPPDPQSIEISEIRINSDPITAFLAKQLDYEVHKDNTVRLKRPFRSLIRKVDSIKKQLSILENQYRYLQNSP